MDLGRTGAGKSANIRTPSGHCGPCPPAEEGGGGGGNNKMIKRFSKILGDSRLSRVRKRERSNACGVTSAYTLGNVNLSRDSRLHILSCPGCPRLRIYVPCNPFKPLIMHYLYGAVQVQLPLTYPPVHPSRGFVLTRLETRNPSEGSASHVVSVRMHRGRIFSAAIGMPLGNLI